MPHRVFSLAEVADYLHLSQDDVLRLVRRREMPFEKQGERLVFRRIEVDAWASQRLLGEASRHVHDFHQRVADRPRGLMQKSPILPQLLDPARIAPALVSKTRASVLRDMVALADGTGFVYATDDLLRSLIDRETMCSTAMPGGLALLHPRHHLINAFSESFVALGRTVQPIPFGAPDGQTTDLFFLICCLEDTLHLQVLARICVLCHRPELVALLRNASDAQAMFDALVQEEQRVLMSM